MKINKENYEAFLLDLWEGTLSEDEKVMLYKFLEENPQLKEEDALNLLGDISITKEKTGFDTSSIDFEKINAKNSEYFFIAYAEGDLSSEEMILVDEFLLENPSLKQKFTQFNKAKLPNETILYPNKKKLAGVKTPVIPFHTKRWILSFAAASIAILFWLSFPFESPNYRYTMTELEELEIERDKSDVNTTNSIKNDLKSINNRFENEIVEQNSSRVRLTKKTTANQQSTVKESEKKDIIRQKEISNPNNKPDLIALKNIEVLHLPDAVTSIVSVRKTEDKTNENQEEKAIDKPQTIGDIAANFLQRKNVLDDERKPDLKGILNNTFSNVNENKKPIIVIEDQPNSKRTIFQLGSLKIERNKKNKSHL